MKNDPRVTKVGGFSAVRIDETPQFYNVLIGDLSIVGPRRRCRSRSPLHAGGPQAPHVKRV
jgi:lipopolysaccharide/colanic/teichoic acid biosynthesis glycosyltransferase